MSQDLSIGRGDNAPAMTWTMPFAVAGSDFALAIAMPGGGSETLTVSGGGLVLDAVANTVTWLVTTAQSAALPYTSLYTLQRRVPGGEVRYYASGRIFGVDGPVGPSSVVVQVAGPQGPLPSNAQIVAAVESVIGQPGGIAGQDALAAEIARAKAAEGANRTASVVNSLIFG